MKTTSTYHRKQAHAQAISSAVQQSNIIALCDRVDNAKKKQNRKEYCLQLANACNSYIQELQSLSYNDEKVNDLIQKNIDFVLSTQKPINTKTVDFFELAFVALQRSSVIARSHLCEEYTFQGRISATGISYLKKYRIVKTLYPGVFMKRIQYSKNARVTINEIDDKHINLIMASLKRRGFVIKIK